MVQSQQSTPYNGPAWSIVSVTDTTIFNRDIGVIQAKRVTFKLYTGQKSYIDIPVDDFNPDNVNSKVDEAATNLFDVMQLQGPQVFEQVSGGPPVTIS